ncbi:unnamed protein product [Blepharisma stoltei]|uniref:Uncharacterized protein n=1 Tax=Blepharisma stoltei TaxID=1481888 RepID=A0AAU9K574_9CILI|nr:unnamed protein product [Blepharisma stoltei]
MGCGPSEPRGATNGNFTVTTEKTCFKIKVEKPNSNDVNEYTYEAFYLEMPLSALMNFLNFDQNQGAKMDANFISRFDAQIARFRYFIQRLSGTEIENEKNPYEGNMWVPYINGKQIDWDFACEKDMPVKPSDEIIWRYEKLTAGGSPN